MAGADGGESSLGSDGDGHGSAESSSSAGGGSGWRRVKRSGRWSGAQMRAAALDARDHGFNITRAMSAREVEGILVDVAGAGSIGKQGGSGAVGREVEKLVRLRGGGYSSSSSEDIRTARSRLSGEGSEVDGEEAWADACLGGGNDRTAGRKSGRDHGMGRKGPELDLGVVSDMYGVELNESSPDFIQNESLLGILEDEGSDGQDEGTRRAVQAVQDARAYRAVPLEVTNDSASEIEALFETLRAERETLCARLKELEEDFKRNERNEEGIKQQRGGIAHKHKSGTIKSRGGSRRRKRPGRTGAPGRKTKRGARKAARASVDRTKMNSELRQKYRNFNIGAESFRKRLEVTSAEVLKAMSHRSGKRGSEEVVSEAFQVSATIAQSTTEANEIRRTTELLRDGGVGYMPSVKEEGRVRVYFENVNSLCLGTQTWKLDKLNTGILQGEEIDVVALCETQVDWRCVGPDEQFLHLIRPGVATKGSAVNNITGRVIKRDQVGGTAVAAIGRLSDQVADTDVDSSGLGRWAWIKVSGDGGVVTYIVSAYYPRKPGTGGKETAYESIGDMRPHTVIFEEDLVSLILGWREGGANVILCIDSNQNVYTGSLAERLTEGKIGMFCAVKEVTGEEAPASWFRGSEPISTVYCSPGVVILNVALRPFYWGLGDHHAHIIEVTSESVFGGNYARVPQRSSRMLNCAIDRTRRQYVGSLVRLATLHKMHDKLDSLFTTNLSVEDLTREHEKFDRQMGELMASAEASCTRYKSREIEFSPEVNILIKRKQVLSWILRYIDGKVPHPGRLERAARAHCIENALELTREEVEGRIQVCKAELAEI